ncbi:MAG: hypothetical protein ABR552_08460, partial [Actinomycetota bacterium]
MSGTIGVIVAHDDVRVAEEVAEVLEAAPDLFVAASSVASAMPGHVVVAGGEALATLRSLDAPLVALAGGEPIRAARAALAAGATDLLSWPADAARLAGSIRRAASGRASVAPRGRVVAVAGARGGLGVSVLCAAIASASPGAIVLDLDAGAGQRAFLDEPPRRTMSDLTDPAPEDLEAALVEHPGGARCLHAAAGVEPSARAVHAVLRAARGSAAITVVDAGRCHAPGARAAFGAADSRIVVAGNDVSSVRSGIDLAGDATML